MSTKPLKRYSTSLLARKMQIKTRKYYHTHQNYFKKLTIPSGDENMKHLKLSYNAGGNIKWYSHFGKLLWASNTS